MQDMLGHSSIVLTADTYTSVLPDVARTAAEKVAALITKVGRHQHAGPAPPRPSDRPPHDGPSPAPFKINNEG